MIFTTQCTLEPSQRTTSAASSVQIYWLSRNILHDKILKIYRRIEIASLARIACLALCWKINSSWNGVWACGIASVCTKCRCAKRYFPNALCIIIIFTWLYLYFVQKFMRKLKQFWSAQICMKSRGCCCRCQYGATKCFWHFGMTPSE